MAPASLWLSGFAVATLWAAALVSGQAATLTGLPVTRSALPKPVEIYLDIAGLNTGGYFDPNQNVAASTTNTSLGVWATEKSNGQYPGQFGSDFVYNGDSQPKAIFNSHRGATTLMSATAQKDQGSLPVYIDLVTRPFDPFGCGTLGINSRLLVLETGATEQRVRCWDGEFGAVPDLFCSAKRDDAPACNAASECVVMAMERQSSGSLRRRQCYGALEDLSKLPNAAEYQEYSSRIVHWLSDFNDAPTINIQSVNVGGATTNAAHFSSPQSSDTFLTTAGWADTDQNMGYCVYKALVVDGGVRHGGGSWQYDNGGGFTNFAAHTLTATTAQIFGPGTSFRYRSDGTAGTSEMFFRAYDGTEFDNAQTATVGASLDVSTKRGGEYATSANRAQLQYTVTAPAATTGVPTTGVPTTGTPPATTTGVPTTGVPTTGPVVTTTGMTTAAPATTAPAATTAPPTTAVPTTTAVVTTAATQVSESSSASGNLLFIIIGVTAGVCCLILVVVAVVILRRRKGDQDAGDHRAEQRGSVREEESDEPSVSESDADVVVYANVQDVMISSEDASEDTEASSSSGEVVYAAIAEMKNVESSDSSSSTFK
jgi:hypothetical protein